jgi:hypothetical protein
LAAKVRREAVKGQEGAVPGLVVSLAAIAAGGRAFRILDHLAEVFDGVLGVATETQVTAGVNESLMGRITLRQTRKRVQRWVCQAV